MKSILSKNFSSDILHPAEKEGKNPKRSSFGNLDVPS